jgi:hypothetical protein
MTIHQTIGNGIAGVASSSLAVISTFQVELDWWVRITGGFLGIAVAAITLYRLIASMIRNQK